MPPYPPPELLDATERAGGNSFVLDKPFQVVRESGKPMFQITVGNKTAKYYPSNYRRNTWVHLAVVRKNNVFFLYVNGQHRIPHNGGFPTAGSAKQPNGTLRFGRSKSQNQQAYGLLDDVAVFNRSLSAAEIAKCMQKNRLTGYEQGLLAGWCFDKPTSSSKPLPVKLNSWMKRTKTYQVTVSANRASSGDAQHFSNTLFAGLTSRDFKLPFPKNSVWKVSQGYDDPAVSHNGYAAFAYDFVRADGKTAHKTVTHAVGGKIRAYFNIGPVPAGKNEPYSIKVEYAPGEFVRYLHLAKDSFPKQVTGGGYDRIQKFFFLPESLAPSATPGTYVGKVGPVGKHLHFGALNRLKNGGVTFPAAFINYWVSRDQGATWKFVPRGIPAKGEWIKRTQ